MVLNLKRSFKSLIIEEANWMDVTTKATANEKVMNAQLKSLNSIMKA